MISGTTIGRQGVPEECLDFSLSRGTEAKLTVLVLTDICLSEKGAGGEDCWGEDSAHGDLPV